MRSVRYVSDNGREISFDAYPPYIFKSLDTNMGSRSYTITIPGADGTATQSVNRTGRQMNFVGYVCMDDNAALDAAMNDISLTFDPAVWGTLYYTNEEGTYNIRCRAIAIPTPTKLLGDTPNKKIDIDFTSDSPFFQTEPVTVPFGYTVPMFSFPFSYTENSLVFGEEYNRALVTNPIHINIYPTFEVLSATDTIRIDNLSTGASFTLKKALTNSQKVIIDTYNQEALLYQLSGGQYVYAGDVTNWITLSSKMYFAPGQNILTINQESESLIPTANIRYSIPVLGV